MRKVGLLSLVWLLILLAGCGRHKAAPSRPMPIATKTVLDWKVAVESVRRAADGHVEVSLLLTQLRQDPSGTMGLSAAFAILPNGKRVSGSGRVENQPGAVRVVWSYPIPASVNKMSLKAMVVSHEGSRFRFNAFTKKDLPITLHKSKIFLTVQDIGFHHTTNGGNQTVFVELKTNSGYSPSDLRLTEDRKRLVLLEQPDWEGNTWVSSTNWYAARRPTQFSLEAASTKDICASVIFSNLSVERAPLK